MAKPVLPELEDIRNRVAYDPDAGLFTWLARPISDFRPTNRETAEIRCQQWNSRCAGRPAFGSMNRSGYMVGHFRAKLLYAHRVAFFLKTGRWANKVDHINGDRSDNRWANLREVTDRENLMNCKTRCDSATGRTGVRPNRRSGRRFVCYIKDGSRSKYLGSFDTMDEAVAARRDAERALGFSERHGCPR